MKVRYGIGLFGVALLVSVVAFPSPKPQPPEPSYGGRTLTQLAMLNPNALNHNPRSEEAKAAILKIGTKSLPCLLAWLAAKPNYTPSKQGAYWLLKQLPEQVVPQKFSDWAYDPVALHFEVARYLFATLGPEAAPAIPDLERLATDPRAGRSALFATYILGGIGPQALPALRRIQRNPNCPSRNEAAKEVARLRAQPYPESPAPHLSP
jgi:hypothetical protein